MSKVHINNMSILDRIASSKAARLQNEKKNIPIDVMRYMAESTRQDVPDFHASLLESKNFGIIAEIKRASPSCGAIDSGLQPGQLALEYEKAGVQAISVLTEEDFFCGSKRDFEIVRSAVSLPLLRKDFIIDPWQIYESITMGASAILLICSLLDDYQLDQFLRLSEETGIAALVEIHDLNELMRALSAGAKIIGINNRDLHTFKTNLAATERLAGLIPPDRLVISESGIKTPEDFARIYKSGAHAALIGESLVRVSASADNIPSHIAALRQKLPL